MTPLEIHATDNTINKLEEKKYFFPFSKMKIWISELKLGYPNKDDDYYVN